MSRACRRGGRCRHFFLVEHVIEHGSSWSNGELVERYSELLLFCIGCREVFETRVEEYFG